MPSRMYSTIHHLEIMRHSAFKSPLSYPSSQLFTVTSTNEFNTPSPLLSKSGLKLVCIGNIVDGNLKSENSQDNAQTPQLNCTFVNSASGKLQYCFMRFLKKTIYSSTSSTNIAPLTINCATEQCTSMEKSETVLCVSFINFYIRTHTSMSIVKSYNNQYKKNQKNILAHCLQIMGNLQGSQCKVICDYGLLYTL